MYGDAYFDELLSIGEGENSAHADLCWDRSLPIQWENGEVDVSVC
jgi:hypothetical protein